MDYAIACEVNFVVNSAGLASFQWLGPDNNPLSITDGFMVLSTGSSSRLEFAPARESQAGMYSCQATVGTVTINETASEVVVNSKKLTIVIVGRVRRLPKSDH